MKIRHVALLGLVAAATLLTPLIVAQVPVFAIAPQQSTITFNVNSSIQFDGVFDKWDATLTFKSPDMTTGGFGCQDSRLPA